MKKIFFVCSLLLLHVSTAYAKFDPAFTWTTIETPHFLIHYHQGEEEIAKRVAVLSEDVHARLVPRIKWEPKYRTHLVLVDAMDNTNGLTTVFPYNHITLYITQPVGGPGFGTMPYDDWMRLLITHEYVHVLHLDMINGGLGGLMHAIFGRLYFPNQFAPQWMIEGLATYEETEQSSGGRGHSPGTEMIIRMAALEDRFPRVSQAAVFPDFWPAGDVPYLFGEEFTRYIVQKYGREKLADIYVTYSGRAVPFLIDSTGKRVLNQKYSPLWNEWQYELNKRYSTLRKELTSQGLTRSFPLTRRGYMNVSPAFSPDGKQIAYLVVNEDEFPGIYMMNADGSGDRKLVLNATSTTSSGESIAWSPDGRGIYYTKIDVERNTNLYNDIFYYDLVRGREVRITRGLRARDPFPSPDGRHLLFVSNRLGRTRLGMVAIPQDITAPLQEKDVDWLTEESSSQYETPRYSPDGAMIALGIWQPGGYRDIWILDSRGNKVEELMHDRAIDCNAIWSPDGKNIYFASDRSGIFNLYAYEHATKKILQISNVLGGAFTPAPSPDGKTLAFSSYSSQGYDLHIQQSDSASWRLGEPYADRYPVMHYDERPVGTTMGPYTPLPTLVPRFWFPWYGYSTQSSSLYGFLTFAQDAVERHSYFVTGLYSPTTYRRWYSLSYVYDGLFPSLRIAASDVDGTYSALLTDPRGSWDYVEREKMFSASVVLPLLKIERQQALTIGYRRTEISALTQIPPSYTGVLPAEGILASGLVSYQFNSAKQYGFSISPEDGRTIELGYERFDKSLGSDFNITKYTADWHEYVTAPWKHHVLLVRAFAGASQGDEIPQGAFQLGGDNPGNSTIPVDAESIYLRGYPVNAFRGRKAALGSLEYRFPMKDIELGWSSTPVFFRRLHGAVFAEAGNAWDDAFLRADLKRSIGAEVRLDTDLAYQFPITLRLVITEGLDEKGESGVYLSLWMPALF